MEGVGVGSLESVSLQTLEYYPYQVKGYQNTYPGRTVLVLEPVDARQLSSDVAPPVNKVAIGITSSRDETVVQRLYSDPLSPIVQGAIVRSAEEAGMAASAAPTSVYDPEAVHDADYVLATKVQRCWAKKHRGTEGSLASGWSTVAYVVLMVTVYKPPFKVPFWEGSSGSTYYDPPIGNFGLMPQDLTAIYDEPGQVLSVALTRAVAGIFQHQDLRSLMLEDNIRVN